MEVENSMSKGQKEDTDYYGKKNNTNSLYESSNGFLVAT